MKTVPEWISHYQKYNIGFVTAGEDVIAAGLDEFTVCLNDRAAIERFLLVLCLISPSAQDICNVPLGYVIEDKNLEVNSPAFPYRQEEYSCMPLDRLSRPASRSLDRGR